MRAVPLLLMLLATASAPAVSQSTTLFDTVKQPQPGSVDSTTQADDVRMKKDVSERMTVPVRLGDTGPFRFLVDTGADRTAISHEVAARLGLVSTETASMHSMTGISTVKTATVPNLQLSQSSMRIVDAAVLDAANMGADGILGTDSLRSKRVIFDFDKKVMTIVPAEQKVVPKDEGSIVVTGRLKNGRLIVTNAVADNQTITVVLDTGAQVSVGNEALRLRLGNHGQLRRTGPVELESVTGDTLQGEYTFVKKLVVGDVGLSNLAVVFADAHTFKRLGLEDRPALLLGMNALRAFKVVSIDFANKKLRVTLPETGGLSQALLAAR
jgi:predicted aspartyl protease